MGGRNRQGGLPSGVAFKRGFTVGPSPRLTPQQEYSFCRHFSDWNNSAVYAALSNYRSIIAGRHEEFS